MKHAIRHASVLSVCSTFLVASTLWAQGPSGVGGTVSEEVTSPAVQAGSRTVVPTTAPGNVSIDFKDADINNVLRILSLKSQVNIVAGPEVTGTVTIRLEDVPWEKALDVVLRTYGYVYERKDNIIRVTTKENIATEELVTETFVLNYTTAAEVEEAIKDILSERGRIKAVARTNMVVVTDIPTNLYKMREVIAKLDKATPQAHIDSKIVKTQRQLGENLGINWTVGGTAKGAERPWTFPFDSYNRSENSDPFDRWFNRYFPGLTGTAAVNPFNPRAFPLPDDSVATEGGGNLYTLGTLDFTSLQAVLELLRLRGNTKEISNPRITVLNNQTAKVKVGLDVALPTFERNEETGSFEISGYEYRETGVVMDVTPHINDANEILVDLKPEVSARSGSTSFSSSTSASFTQLPNFSVTTAETQVLIKSGETIAIGGLLTDASATVERKIPVLGDIPLFGKIFRSKRQTQDETNQKVETLFFVTVTVVDTEGEPTSVLVPISGNAAVGAGRSPATQPTVTTQSSNVEKV